MIITFTQLCVGIVIVGAVGIVTFMSNLLEKDSETYLIGWMISTIGFGVCLTVILYLTGIISKI
jgi:hypothetical protein